MTRIASLFMLALVASCYGSDQPQEPGHYSRDFYTLDQWSGVLALSVPWLNGEANFTASITVTNVGTTPLVGDTGPTWWRFRVFQTAERTGDPLWEGWSTTPQGVGERVDLQPGSSAAFFTARIPYDALGAMASGTYYVSASLAFLEPRQRTPFSPAGTIELVR